MFFWLSKLFWVVAAPANLLLLALLAATALAWTRWRGALRAVLGVTTAAALAVLLTPLPTWPLVVLEERFPPPVLPDRVAGIVVLGGFVDPVKTAARGQMAIGGAAERIVEAALLARRYPDARLIFSGGSGDPLNPDEREAEAAKPLFDLLGIGARIEIEPQARNTHENAVYARALAQPREGETWILVTSATHMPRAVGCFRQAGFPVLPLPVDYLFAAGAANLSRLDFGGRLGYLGHSIYEWLGLFAYRLTGRTDTLLPGPARGA